MSNLPQPAPPTAPEPTLTPEQRRLVIVGVFLLIFLIVGAVAAVYFMVSNPAQTTVIRDIFIIFMAIESMFIGFALVILMIQLARLTNMLQHEIKPILENTNDTVNTVRGTAIFVSENLVEPVVKLNSYLAAFGKMLELMNLFKK